MVASNRIGGDSTIAPKLSPIELTELLDVNAVTILLGNCSRRHVRRLADSGRMPRPIKLGSLIRWRRAELMVWLQGGCQPIRTVKDSGR